MTGAVWSDVDNDGWIDLLVAQEWGPIKYFRNDEGQLVDQTSVAGLSNVLGWWNGITAIDVDNDGDMDYAATNFGLNTKYHASAKKPTLCTTAILNPRARRILSKQNLRTKHSFPSAVSVARPVRCLTCWTSSTPIPLTRSLI